MELSSQETRKIARDYNLGKVKSSNLINGGAVNYNFDLKTEKGNFIIRVMGQALNSWKIKRLELVFKTLEYLNKNHFPYKIPEPVRNRQGEYISNVFNHNLWIYPKLVGNTAKRINMSQVKAIAKAIATYHKFISKMRIKKDISNNYWLVEKYAQLKEVKPEKKIDKLMLANLETFTNQLNNFLQYNFKEDILINHTDFNRSNFLFIGNRVVGILDFDNIEISPKIRDIAYGIRCFCFNEGMLMKAREKAFLSEYKKTRRISKGEKEMIIPFINRDNCVRFWWSYSEMKKLPKKRYNYLKSVINLNQNLQKF